MSETQNNGSNGAGVELAEFVEVHESVPFSGIVKFIHDGYCFIGDVRRQFETINTRGDVFCPLAADQVIEVGDMVEFSELNPDMQRPGKFRAESVVMIVPAAEVATSNLPVLRALNFVVKAQTLPYHANAKDISEAEVDAARANQPFRDMLPQVVKAIEEGENFDMAEHTEDFLTRTFSALMQVGVDTKVDGSVDVETEARMIQETAATYRENDMVGQAESLEHEYATFTAIRRAFVALQELGLLRLDSVLPKSCLPELFMAAPVWFIDAKDQLPDNEGQNDPQPDQAVKFFADFVGTKEFAWLYQMYNRRTRPIRKFKGRDIFPPALLKVLKTAREVFDYVVIMTPYHDVASKEWADPEWQRNIDPYLVGFHKDLPFMFLLGRWSGSGLFPLACEMIADTMGHISTHRDGLAKFSRTAYWYRGNEHGCLVSNSGSTEDNQVLPLFADELLKAYEVGHLFDFIRNTWQPEASN